jgi:hypothetical protein|uniref:Uncharacterized protein n=1 Tax=viral metagenome TaxID=1070528 RepID=A0A6C0J1V2_9ZZZZ
MVCILVDYNCIIHKNNLKNISDFLQNLPDAKNYSIGVIFELNPDTYTELENNTRGNEKIDFFNSKKFIDNIINYSYIVYDIDRKICEIFLNNNNMLEDVLKIILENLPNDITIILFVELEKVHNKEYIRYLSLLGFGEPFIVEDSELKGIYLHKLNYLVDSKDITTDIEYLLKSISSEKCESTLRFTSKTIEKLKYLSKIGSSWNSKSISQKELGGRFLASLIDDLIINLEIDDKSIIYGEEEGVRVVGGLYNFHSHPQEAYERNNVTLGWPSGQDFIAFLSSHFTFNTLIHVVVAVEGVYILQMGDYWDNLTENNMNDITKFIDKEYDLACFKDKLSIPGYVSKINGIKFENKTLFNLYYSDWNNISNPFTISFKKIYGNCIINQNLNNFIDSYYK